MAAPATGAAEVASQPNVQAATAGPGQYARDLVALTKPRIIELLLVTTVPTMALAAEGWPGLGLVVATMVGGTLTAGCANTLNNVVEADRDRRMRRTRDRPVAARRVSGPAATGFAVLLGAVGTVLLWSLTTPLAAVAALFAIVYYVVVYTVLAKPRTTQAVVIGGVAGSMPVLTGWAAVTGNLTDPVVWALFAVLFLWQPPHFWALATVHRDDYEAAALPMLPVVRGVGVASRHSLTYVYATTAALLALVLLADSLAVAVLAVPTAAWWLRHSHRLVAAPTAERAAAAFRASIVFLTVVFVAAPLAIV